MAFVQMDWLDYISREARISIPIPRLRTHARLLSLFFSLLLANP